MKKIMFSIAALVAMGGFAVAGGPVAAVPVAVIPLEHDTSGLYVSGALYYNNVYSAKYAWFNDATDTQDEVGGLTGIIGYNYNEYLAFEARASKSLFEEDYADEYNFSFFLKPQYRFRDGDHYEDNYFTLYGLIGFGYVNVEGTDGNTPAATEVLGKTIVDDWAFQYGIGLSYTFVDTDNPQNDSGDWSIFVEYNMHMHNKSITPTRLYNYNPNKYDKISMNGLNVGIAYQF